MSPANSLLPLNLNPVPQPSVFRAEEALHHSNTLRLHSAMPVVRPESVRPSWISVSRLIADILRTTRAIPICVEPSTKISFARPPTNIAWSTRIEGRASFHRRCPRSKGPESTRRREVKACPVNKCAALTAGSAPAGMATPGQPQYRPLPTGQLDRVSIDKPPRAVLPAPFASRPIELCRGRDAS